MNGQTREEKLLALALAMPKYDDFVAEQYRNDPELALEMIQDEFREYVKTNDISYLLSTLRKVVVAKGNILDKLPSLKILPSVQDTQKSACAGLRRKLCHPHTRVLCQTSHKKFQREK
jgi:hypothetical protein